MGMWRRLAGWKSLGALGLFGAWVPRGNVVCGSRDNRFPVVIVRIKKPWPPRGRAPGRFVSCGDHGSEQVADVVFALMVVAGGRLSPATPEGIGRATSLPVRYSIDRENFKPLMSFHVKKRNQKMVASHFDTQ